MKSPPRPQLWPHGGLVKNRGKRARRFLRTAAVGADHRAARPTGTTGILPVAEAVFVLDFAFVFSRVEHVERVDYSAAL